jgi:hypothetical protein
MTQGRDKQLLFSFKLKSRDDDGRLTLVLCDSNQHVLVKFCIHLQFLERLAKIRPRKEVSFPPLLAQDAFLAGR